MAKGKYIKMDGRMIFVPDSVSQTDDSDLVDFIIKEEGFLKEPTNIGDGKTTLGSGLTDPKWHKLYRQRGNRWSEEDNRRAVAEEVAKRRKWAEDTVPNWDNLPPSAQKAMLSYKYNYNFTPENSPLLFNAMNEGRYRDALLEMNATSKDDKFKKGLMERRKREQSLGLSDYPEGLDNFQALMPSVEQIPVSTATSTFSVIPEPQPVMIPRRDQYISVDYAPGETRITERAMKALENQRKWNELKDIWNWYKRPEPDTFITLSKADGGQLKTQKNKLWDELSMAEKSDMMKLAVENGVYELDTIRDAYNMYANGGGIHIAPSKRGTFTAAAKKHGKSVQAFAAQVLAHPENYSPEMRKKANFARNAAKWKHELGGPLVEAAKAHQYGLGDYLRKGLDWLGNAIQVGAIAENPAVMTAAGWEVDNGKAVQNRQNAPEVQQLRKNLAAIGDAALTAPTLGADLEALYQGGKHIIMHPMQSARIARQAVIKGSRATKESVKRGIDAVRQRITAKNAATITDAQWDAAYNAALKFGDITEAQRLRDLHFMAKAPDTKITTLDGNPQHIYHGTDADWVSYDPLKFSTATDDGYFGVGLYGTERKSLAKGYGDNVLDLYVNARRPFTAGTQDILGKPYDWNEAIDRSSAAYLFNRNRVNTKFQPASKNTDVNVLFNELDNSDAVVYGIPKERFNEVVIPDGKQIKLADPITYDDSWNVIPLSRRDNFRINDIRYGLLPFIGAGLYQYNNKKGNADN